MKYIAIFYYLYKVYLTYTTSLGINLDIKRHTKHNTKYYSLRDSCTRCFSRLRHTIMNITESLFCKNVSSWNGFGLKINKPIPLKL